MAPGILSGKNLDAIVVELYSEGDELAELKHRLKKPPANIC